MRIKNIIAALLLAIVLTSSVQAQRKDMPSKRRHDMFGRDIFAYRYFNFADTLDAGMSRMEFHVGVVNDLLTFIKTDEATYKARYEVAVVIYDKNDEPIVEESVSGRVTAESYAETNLRKMPHNHVILASLPPGNYKGTLQLIDLESNESLTKELEFTARDFGRGEISTSDIIFVDKIDTVNAKLEYTINLSHVFDNVKSAFAAYVEFYPAAVAGDVNVHIDILDAKGTKLYQADKIYDSSRKVIPAVIPFREHLKKPGEYILVLSASENGKSTRIQRMFSVIWSNVPVVEHNLEIAIEQLALVAQKNDIEEMRNADLENRKQLYDAYWKKRDPSPQTKKNELEEEFFRRVDFTNRNFTEISTGRSGWRTDRGKIYIVYGAPEQVNHNDNAVQAPATEIWYYNRLNRKYYFTDRSGDGVYRLVKVE